MLRNLSHLENLAEEYEIPKEDVLLIAFNTSGIVGPYPYKRIRFAITPLEAEDHFYFAVCVNSRKSPFYIDEETLFLFRDKVADIDRFENDKAELSYFRKQNNSLVLNTNKRSSCTGCAFCGVDVQDKNDSLALTERKNLREHLEKIIAAQNLEDFSDLEEVTLCTRCFPTEEALLSHLKMIREEMGKLGYEGPIKYIGSRLMSFEALKEVKRDVAPFEYYLTVECFEDRQELLSHHKLDLTVEKGKSLLEKSKKLGFETSVLYILGLDSLESMTQNFSYLAPALTRFPVVNLYQNYKPQHEKLRHPEARKMDYYLQARNEIEQIFQGTSLRPKLWENYRSPWYTSFGGELITSPEHQTYAATTK